MHYHSQQKTLLRIEKRLAKLKATSDGILIYVLGLGGCVDHSIFTTLTGKSIPLKTLNNEAAVREWLSQQRLTNCVVICDDIH